MIPSLLSALLGGGAPPDAGKVDARTPEAPHSTEDDFVSALLRAFGSADLAEPGSNAAHGPAAAHDAPLHGAPASALFAGPSVVAGTSAPSTRPELDLSALSGTDRSDETDSGAVGKLAPTDDRTVSSEAVNDTPTLSAAPNDVSMADRSWERLDPNLRSKLETVVHRMDAEFGHEVRLIEGYRSPDRQSHLFEQGRSRPGPVVTWTLDSEHLAGRAVDVQIDGSFEVGSGYSRLQQVAAEEGLRTLGMRDPGHLELPNLPGSRSATLQLRQEGSSLVQEAPQAISAPVPDGIARPAQVAGIARIAQVARVAQIAQIARPGQGRPAVAAESGAPADAGPSSATPGAPMPLVIPDPEPRAPVSSPRLGLTFADLGGEAVQGDESRSGRGASLDGDAGQAPPSEVTTDHGAQARLAALDILAAGTEGAVGRVAAQSSSGLDTMSRVESVLHARELAGTAFPGRVSLRLDGTGGPMDQVRVGLLGSAVEADLDLADADTAALVRSRVSELHTALESRGLELGSLGVTTSGAELSGDPLLGGRLETNADLLRSLLGATAGDTSRDSSGRERWEQQKTNDDGTESDRPRRETSKEE